MRTAAFLCALLLCGCHESLGLVGDARMDPRPDGTDAGTDTSTEPASDPADAYEVPADILHDGTEACVPPGDGVWLDWTLDGAEWDDRREIDIPCRIVSVAGEDVGHTIIDLECGTGGVIERLEAAAGAPIDSVIAAWRARAVASKPAPTTLRRLPGWTAFAWIVILVTAASRSTRWRLG